MRQEIQELLHKAHQSLQVAELLNKEGHLDFAVSRAYYAMFYAAQALLLRHGLSFSGHAAVIGAFGK
ncbi:MAG: HEPN domain-containing protein, partial [Anaerolineae bacterium]|nr:HEPN domain-containing protein [Anaerolineae bacterium]